MEVDECRHWIIADGVSHVCVVRSIIHISLCEQPFEVRQVHRKPTENVCPVCKTRLARAESVSRYRKTKLVKAAAAADPQGHLFS